MSRSLGMACALFALAGTLSARTVVFWDEGFPAAETEPPPREVLEQGLQPLAPVFDNLVELTRPGALASGDLLVLPYGSAFPADAWDAIHSHFDRGNLLVIGGRPLTVPVRREAGHWLPGRPQISYARAIGVDHTLVASQPGSDFQWDAETNSFQPAEIRARRVFVLASEPNQARRRGLGFFLNSRGDRASAPIIADDFVGEATVPGGGRRVYLTFDPAPGYWASADGLSVLRQAADYASRGAVRLWIELASLTIEPGDRVSGTIEVQRSAQPAASVHLELLTGDHILDSLDMPCGSSLHAPFTFSTPLNDPGLYTVRATLRSAGDLVAGATPSTRSPAPQERYVTGLWVRDDPLLRSGARLEAGRDYLRLDGKPYLAVGTNYFSTDPYDRGFFLGAGLGGNAWRWERDFAEMERHGVTFVRTGVWRNRAHYLDPVSGAASERFLRAFEAYLLSAARHHMQVEFTLFAFEPQTVQDRGAGQNSDRLGPGSNPYTDSAAFRAERAWVQSIAARFKDVPFLHFDLINEPNFSDPTRLWQGNVPHRDPTETSAWHEWLAHHYPSPAALAEAWRVPLSELHSFDAVPLPDSADLAPVRSGNPRLARAFDFNRFAQDAFRQWASQMIQAIHQTGSHQAITIGQDEGGVADRVLNQFYGDIGVAFTVNHTWWRDDALLWDSLVAKRPDKPNLIGETGPQPAWSTNGAWRWDEASALPLLERKLALGFAAGNSGAVHWGWERGDDFGIMRRDGSFKPWIDVLAGIAAFARSAQPFATDARRPEIAIVLPQSLQLSVWNSWAIEAQQKAVRALYQYARQSAYTLGEFQLDQIGNPKLIIVPSPWIFQQDAWDKLMAKVRAGATLLISGRIDADEHFWAVPSRIAAWAPNYSPGLLTTRENVVTWAGESARLSYGADKTTYAERGMLADGSNYLEVQVGGGKVIYFTFPVESNDNLDSIARIYQYAIRRAGVSSIYGTSSDHPGLLISATQWPEATLYVVTSESSSPDRLTFRDEASGVTIQTQIQPGRASLLLLGHDGRTIATYNWGDTGQSPH